MDGNFTEALIGKGLVDYELDKYGESQRLIDKAFMIEPVYTQVLSDFGLPFSNATKNDQVMTWLDRLLVVPPERINELVTSNRSHILRQSLN
jgi:hypothetical protein